MAKTITFDKKGVPSKMEDGVKISKNLHWIHVDQATDEEIADLIAYEFFDAGMSRDLRENPRPSIRLSQKHEIIKLTFPRESGIYQNENENLVIRFILSRNALITISNSSEEIEGLMSELYVNKLRFTGSGELFKEITSRMINKSYDVLESLDMAISEIRKGIFEDKKKHAHLKRSEDIRENIYQLYMLLLANVEVFEQLDDSKLITYDQKMNHIDSRISNLKDIVGGQKENLSRMSELYLGVISANMSKYMYKLTVLGAVLLIPTVIAGFYGMNVGLPDAGFWTIVGVSAFLAFTSGLFMSWWAKK